MIRSVTVTNSLGESLEMELFYPERSGIAIIDITGIGAPDADIQTSDLVSSDGSIFASARAKERLITFTLRPLFDPDIETARQRTYKYFPIKSKVTLDFHTDNRDSTISGYVKSNTPTIFSQKEEIVVEVSCPDPWFYRYGEPVSVVFSGIDPMFEFPFSNEKLEDDVHEWDENIEHYEYDRFGRVINHWTEVIHHVDVDEFSRNLVIMGEIKDDLYAIVTYEGEAEVGFSMFIHAATGAARNISVYNMDTGEHMTILTDKIQSITGEPWKKSDEIIINTRSGQRGVRLLRGGIYYNIINALDRDSDWLLLRPGDNQFAYMADEDELTLEFKMEYLPAYQGV